MSYRRDDTDYPAAWLFRELAKHFGRDQVFKDVDSIELGDDFIEVITNAVASCHVLLALIGTQANAQPVVTVNMSPAELMPAKSLAYAEIRHPGMLAKEIGDLF